MLKQTQAKDVFLKQAHERMRDKGFFANDTRVLVRLTCIVECQLLGLHREKRTRKLLERFLWLLATSEDLGQLADQLSADPDSRGVLLRQTHVLRQEP